MKSDRFGVFLVRIQSKCGKTPNAETFYAVLALKTISPKIDVWAVMQIFVLHRQIKHHWLYKLFHS